MEFSDVVSLVDHLSDELLIALRQFCESPAAEATECCQAAEAPLPKDWIVVTDHKMVQHRYYDAYFEVAPGKGLTVFKKEKDPATGLSRVANFPENCYAYVELKTG